VPLNLRGGRTSNVPAKHKNDKYYHRPGDHNSFEKQAIYKN